MRPTFVAAPIRLLTKPSKLGMGSAQARPAMTAASGVSDRTRAIIREHNVQVFSKSYCPYCRQVKALFNDLNVPHNVWELDERDDGGEVQSFLLSETGQRTVPNVFIKGKHIGGCDDTLALHSGGKLLDMVKE